MKLSLIFVMVVGIAVCEGFQSKAWIMDGSRRQHLSVSSKRLSMAIDTYDLAVVGGGVAGVQAALAAASEPMNKKVCLIDAPRASGVLMNEETGEDLSLGAPTGLFSKALRDTSKCIKVSTLRGMGLREESIWNEIISNCVELASSNAQDIIRQMEFAGVTYIEGKGSFSDSGDTHDLFVTKSDSSIETIRASNFLICTGSQPFRPGGIPFDGKRVFDSDSINQVGYFLVFVLREIITKVLSFLMVSGNNSRFFYPSNSLFNPKTNTKKLGFLPKSIAITGSGIIAVEFAKIFRNLGAEVTLIIRDQIPR